MAFVDAFERAINGLKLCPNRVWAVCGKDLPKLLPIDDNVPSHKDHDQCTYEHCEWSQRDFTAVEQRHECASKESCAPLHGFFSEEVLKQYPEKGGSTVWSLEGRILLQLPRPYMAISHVWSDGTGTGSWPAGQVNPCLYLFFRKLAYQFQCEGIWWDTLCIPRDKELRTKVIRNMHQMYRHARVTLVHDIFLREWTWVDAEHACFAILMSPWFSRGWTALELAESRKVKVIFGGEDGPLIKDLDEEILAKDGSSYSHKEASKLIENLRRGITDLNGLLAVIGPRYTSWQKDVAIIAGLLLDIDIAPRQNQKDVWAQDIYKRALLHMGTLYPGHLFHNTATISNGNSWCPISLVNMPKACGGYTLNIEKNMDITGTWNYIPISKQNVLVERCVWRNMHPFMQEKIKRCLDDPKDCILLAELSVKSDDVSSRLAPSNQIQIQRAILVRKVYNGPPLPLLPLHLYLGALDFQPAIVARDVNSQGECLEKEIKIQGEAYSNESEIRIDNSDTSISQAITQGDEQSTPALTVCSGWSELHLEVWTRPHNADNNAWDGDINCQDERGQQALHLAAERGTVDHVSRLLEHPDIDPREDVNGQTALHRAAWGGSLTIVNMLLDKDKDLNKLNVVDYNGNTALHIASAKGFTDIVKALVQKTKSLRYQVEQRFTPLHFAAYYGHISVAQALIEEDAETYLSARDTVIGWTPLHFAALAGQKGLCEWLIEKQPALVDAEDDKIKWTPIYCAIVGDHRAVFELLATKSAHTTAADSAGFTPQQLGDFLNHHKNAVSTQEKGEGKIPLPTIEVEAPLLYFIATCGQHAIAQALFNSAHETNWPSVLWKGKSISNNIINAKGDSGMTILHLSTGRGFLGLVQQLIDEGCNIDETDDDYTTPLLQATVRGQEEVVQLLLKKVANAEAWNQDYNTGLLFSAERGFDKMVRLFLDNGANIENGGQHRQTPLSRAAERGHDKVVRILLEGGANKNSLDRCGQTPLSWAAEQGRETVVRLLLEAGAEPNTRDDYNQTPLSWAEERGYTKICKLLQPYIVLNRI